MRKLTGFAGTIVLALLLVACGNDGEDDEPTAEPAAPTEASIATEVATSIPGTPDDGASASPAVVPAGTPIGIATPAIGGTPVATPAIATPSVDGVMASPAAGTALVPAGASGTGSGETLVLSGIVTLPGTVNERFVISDDGCVGLGSYAGLQAGQQVIIRNEAGTIIGVTQLSATGSSVVCSWSFEVEVPASEFYAVSIPMRAEQVYTADEVANSDGQIELTLP